jgi:membrane-associated phospholipid phosphatase
MFAARAQAAMALAAATLLAAPAARAQDDAAAVYHVRWPTELAVLGTAAVTYAVPQLLASTVVQPTCPCSSDDVPAFDRGALGRHSTTAARASDVAVTTLMLAPFALDAWDVHAAGGGVSAYVADAVVMVEALAVTNAVTAVAKVSAHRPRPFLYDAAPGSPELRATDSYLSFFSGHTSTAFAAGISYASTFALRHPDSPWRLPVLGAAVLAGGSVGTLRVLAGKHFPSDVLAGAVAGGVTGWLLPHLHRRRDLAALLVPTPGGAALLISTRL